MSESDQQTSSSSSEDERDSEFSEDNQVESVFLPYVDDPLADDEWTDEESDDEDGLSPLTLERRYNETDPIQTCFMFPVLRSFVNLTTRTTQSNCIPVANQVDMWPFGWENARPLPACIYHFTRTTITSHHITGYATSRERDN
ncbi:hypothetical protein QZH41_018325 [Actinostola sp. cb2023]|nr:hypothetical protein QZH41_018325 [Actinostola sp. cb2023]